MYIQYTLMAESKVNARLLFLNHLPKIDPFRSGQLPDVGCDSKLQKRPCQEGHLRSEDPAIADLASLEKG